eukprot:365661-Chlamydomonas_euryale.AAC.40
MLQATDRPGYPEAGIGMCVGVAFRCRNDFVAFEPAACQKLDAICMRDVTLETSDQPIRLLPRFVTPPAVHEAAYKPNKPRHVWLGDELSCYIMHREHNLAATATQDVRRCS